MSKYAKKIETFLCKLGGNSFALPTGRLKMLVEDPEIVGVLGAPKLYNRLLVLQNTFYPIVSVQALIPDATNLEVAALIAYIDKASNKPTHGVIEFDGIPERIQVSDDMQIDVNELPSEFIHLCSVGFEYMHEKIGVLDLDAIFNV